MLVLELPTALGTLFPRMGRPPPNQVVGKGFADCGVPAFWDGVVERRATCLAKQCAASCESSAARRSETGAVSGRAQRTRLEPGPRHRRTLAPDAEPSNKATACTIPPNEPRHR